jgi:hypothetical protein
LGCAQGVDNVQDETSRRQERFDSAWRAALPSLLARVAKRFACCPPVCRVTCSGYELLKKKADALKMRFQAMLKEIQKVGESFGTS